ncbi:TrmJ/YjtD family RNA methyltransferase [Candidatus Woesearchaeota archaeon]|nr:TrmJ/YjtD family RNA methyltransferase [Candidatus Woesearchaeota archaeon]
MISVILIGPKNSGNIGAIARLIRNFNIDDLVIIDPQCRINTITARKRAMHAEDIIKKAKPKRSSYLKRFDYLIATTSKLGTDYNIPRSPITSEQLAKNISKIKDKKRKIGIVFGREDKGLFNDEIALCDYTVTIPTSPKYPAMNLSHSVSVILYELFKDSEKAKITDRFIPASKKEKDQVLKMLNKAMKNMDFRTTSKKQTQILVWKKLISKSLLTKREAYALMGFLKKIVK